MLFFCSFVTYVLFVRFCFSSPVSPCQQYLQPDLNDAIKGTYLEGKGKACDASWTANLLEDASSYTKLYLLLRDRSKNYSEIVYGNLTSIAESGFDVRKPTKMLVHGWLEYGFDGFVVDLMSSYFAVHDEDVNILTVDWSETADLLYTLARLSVVPVGEFLAKVLDWMVTDANVSLDSVHIIGLSLGAHVAGTIGEHMTVGKVGRITGLDPAGPEYSTSKTGRLDSTDAQFVDIIHTCGHLAGFFKASGHVDFYPNKGEYNQPGCDIDLGVCSHKRSYHLFNESISDLGFVATRCDSWSDFENGECDDNMAIIMGEHVEQSARGKFYLHTAGSYPYALGQGTSEKNEEL